MVQLSHRIANLSRVNMTTCYPRSSFLIPILHTAILCVHRDAYCEPSRLVHCYSNNRGRTGNDAVWNDEYVVSQVIAVFCPLIHGPFSLVRFTVLLLVILNNRVFVQLDVIKVTIIVIIITIITSSVTIWGIFVPEWQKVSRSCRNLKIVIICHLHQILLE
jgi:hypothetical protein